MTRLPLVIAALLAAMWLAACATQGAPPVPTEAPPAIPASTALPTRNNAPTSAPTLFPTQTPIASSPAPSYAAKTVDGGGVSVMVTPVALSPGAPVSFDVAMNTHSVELKDDLLKAATLRDERGNEVAPIAWDGAGPGGHHRAGLLKFPALSGEPKILTLVIKGVASVPERKFQWELAN